MAVAHAILPLAFKRVASRELFTLKFECSWECVYTVAVHLAVFPRATVLGAIKLDEITLAFAFTIFVSSNEDALFEDVSAFATLLVLHPVAFLNVAVSSYKDASTMSLPCAD